MIYVAVDQVEATRSPMAWSTSICVARSCSILVPERLSKGHPDDWRIRKAEPSRAVRLCGTEEIGPRSRKLQPARSQAEIENGQLRYVAFNGVEALRGIAFLVRDQNWGTYTPQHGKSLGRLVPTVQQGIDLFGQGFDFICYSGDVWVLHDALKDAIDKLREGCVVAEKPKKTGSKR